MDTPGRMDMGWPPGLTAAWQGLQDLLPGLLAAAGVMLGGWLLARILRAATLRIGRTVGRGLGAWYRRVGAPPQVEPSGWALLGKAVYWGVLLAALTAAAQVLALDSFRAWLARLVAYLPTLLSGILILVVGLFLAALVRSLVVAALPAGVSQGPLLARALQGIILITAVVLGADQMGLEVTFLVHLGTVLAGVVAGGAALAVSLGSGPFVQSLIGAHYLRQQVRAGQLLRVRGFEGRVVEVTATTLVLDCSQGRVSLPARVIHDSPMVLRPKGEEDD